MFVNYSKSQEIKRYTEKFVHAYQQLGTIVRKGIHLEFKHADVSGLALYHYNGCEIWHHTSYYGGKKITNRWKWMHGVQVMTTTTMLSFIFSQLSQLYNSKAKKLHFVLLLLCLLQLIFHQFEHQPRYNWFIYFQCMCCIKIYLFPPWRVFWFEVPTIPPEIPVKLHGHQYFLEL